MNYEDAAAELRKLSSAWMETRSLEKAASEGTLGAQVGAAHMVDTLATVLPLMGKLRVRIVVDSPEVSVQ